MREVDRTLGIMTECLATSRKVRRFHDQRVKIILLSLNLNNKFVPHLVYLLDILHHVFWILHTLVLTLRIHIAHAKCDLSNPKVKTYKLVFNSCRDLLYHFPTFTYIIDSINRTYYAMNSFQ